MTIFQIVLQVLSLIGALVLFLYGMKIMSESLQKIAGQKLREVLAKITARPARGILTGFLITALIQSSSASTVLLVSFVNAGLISFTQSIGIIFGANVGTTVTAWLISLVGFGSSFSLNTIMLPLVALSLPLFFSYTNKNKARAEFIIGFALLFIGIYFFKENLPAIDENSEFLHSLQFFDNRFINILMFIGLGILITILFQSSSATITLTMVLASQGWLSYGAALAMVIGENIGTSATANFAAIVANRSAKRTALAHLMFNLFGMLWALPLLGIITDSIQALMNNLVINPGNQIIFGISLFHSGFNILSTILLTIFHTPFKKLCFKLIPNGNESKEDFSLKFIDNNLLSTSELSILQARKEIAHMGKQTTLIFAMLPDLLLEKKEKRFAKLHRKIRQNVHSIHKMSLEISTYISKISPKNISDRSTQRIRIMLSIIDQLNSIGGYCYKMALSISDKNNAKAWFTQELRKNLSNEFKQIEKLLNLVTQKLIKDYNDMTFEDINEMELELNTMRNMHHTAYLEELKRENLPKQTEIFYNDLLALSTKISEHIFGITHLLHTSKKNITSKQSKQEHTNT